MTGNTYFLEKQLMRIHPHWEPSYPQAAPAVSLAPQILATPSRAPPTQLCFLCGVHYSDFTKSLCSAPGEEGVPRPSLLLPRVCSPQRPDKGPGSGAVQSGVCGQWTQAVAVHNE